LYTTQEKKLDNLDISEGVKNKIKEAYKFFLEK
jgi:hypothetical protein